MISMNRRDFIRFAVKSALCVSGGMVAGRWFRVWAADEQKRPPNILFIFIDDLGWKDAGFMGSEYYETPNIDRLAGQGMVFTSAYANAPNCAPSRACLISGMYTPRHGIYTVGNPERGQANLRKLVPIPNRRDLDTSFVTIAEALKRAGYVTGSFGKWHLGKEKTNGPDKHGFDTSVVNAKKEGEDPKRLDALTKAACTFIKDNRATPFFCYLPYFAVHLPIEARDATIDKYRQKQGSAGQNHPAYAAMVEETDTCVGRIMDHLDELGLTDNTVVCFFSDNGGHDAVTSMVPLRGSKGQLYEGGIREPMIVRWPGVVEPGSSCDTPVIGIDFYPTFLEIAGVPKPAGHILDGVSLMPLLTQNGSLDPRTLFWHFPAYLEGYTERQGAFRTTPAAALRQGDWKLHEFFEDGRLELYNLKDDIGEQHNLAEKMPEKTSELHRVMLEWRKTVNAPVPTDRNPLYDPNAKFKPTKRKFN